MNNTQTIDVTRISPALKHPTIFKTFDDLSQGNTLFLLNDHDPKPLYYQLLGERGKVFEWEYLESGPEQWKVRITKSLTGTNEETIATIVTKDFRKAEVFKKFNIDFCCGGKKTIAQACEEKKINTIEVLNALSETEKTTVPHSQQFDKWEPTYLIDYIVDTHHHYVTSAIPVLLEYTRKVAKVHGHRHPELIKIASLFEEAATELSSHMIKEEKILFPFIKQQFSSKQDLINPFGTVQNPIHQMEAEHETVGNIFHTIRELSNDYTPPEDACTTYKICFMKLQEFEDDLHQHVHLENNVLFPKSVRQEG